MISDCTKATNFVLVDNQAFKLKVSMSLEINFKTVVVQAERTMRSEDRLTVRRIRIDLKDFSLEQLPEFTQSGDSDAVPWVALGKHLCGAGTDFAMLACQHALECVNILATVHNELLIGNMMGYALGCSLQLVAIIAATGNRFLQERTFFVVVFQRKTLNLFRG